MITKRNLHHNVHPQPLVPKVTHLSATNTPSNRPAKPDARLPVVKKKKSLWGFFANRYSITIVKSVSGSADPPHPSTMVISGKAIACSVALIIFLLCGSIISLTLYTLVAGQIEESQRELRIALSELDSFHEASHEALQLASTFENVFSQVTSLAGIQAAEPPYFTNEGTAVPIRANTQEYLGTNSIYQVITALDGSLGPLTELRDLLFVQGTLLNDIPNLWPVSNNHGHVTMEFGPNRHPQNNQWYLHKGIDIAGSYGAGVLASANGKVIGTGYDADGYGRYVLLRHKYGFRTRYSHLSRIYVTEGEEVSQGQPIGAIGNTGISTGPHLDFQVILGTDVIDPSLFLKISRRGFARWSGNR